MMRFMHNTFWILSSVIFCFGLSAIQAAAQNKTACQLITKADLESVTGYKLQSPQVIPAVELQGRNKKADKEVKDFIASLETASSGCSYQLTPASQDQTQYKEESILQIGVRYLRTADAELFYDKLKNTISGGVDLRVYSKIELPYPALRDSSETVIAFKETPSGTIMLQIRGSLAPKSLTRVDAADFAVDMRVKIALKILGGAGTLPGTPNNQILSSDDTLKGLNGMTLVVNFNGNWQSSGTRPYMDMVDLLRQNGIKVVSRNNATTLPTLQLDIDTLYVSQFNGPGFVVYTMSLKFLQLFPARNQNSLAKFVQVSTWSVGSFGVNGSDGYRNEAVGLTSQFIKSYFNVNGKK